MTYKGCKRKIIVLDNPGGDMFEQAYFILKNEKENIPESDMIKEANRIVGEAMDKSPLFGDAGKKKYIPKSKRNKLSRIKWLVTGTALGVVLSYLFAQLIV